MSRPEAALYAVTDVHGFRRELLDALHYQGLVDDEGRWSGGDARLWFLGDYVDRGPDGLRVVDDIRRLAREAVAAGGEVGGLLGNHEVKLLAAHRFGSAPVPGLNEPDGFLGSWRRHGGQEADRSGLTPDQVAWIESLPAVALVAGHLLVHSDTTRYLELGRTVGRINAAVRSSLSDSDPAAWLDFIRWISDRGAFRAAPAAVDDMLETLGGEVLVHGHTPLSRILDVPPLKVSEPVRYAGGRVVAIDGGAYEGGPLLVTRLV